MNGKGSLLLAFEGSICLWEGEELGQTDTALDFEELTDPQGINFWPEPIGRDNTRTPMVWDASPNAGFTTGRPWLPVKPEQAARNVAAQEGAHTLGARIGGQIAEVFEQRHRVFQTRRIDEAHRHRAVDAQIDRLGVPGGARAVGHFTKVHLARQRAQQRSLAGIGVADDGDAKRFSHGPMLSNSQHPALMWRTPRR